VVLLELRIENLLLIERAELRPGPGLTTITGETGAGKTVLAHALDLLLGGKPRAGIVRPGAREAYVEGVFEMPAGILGEPELADLRERIWAEPDEAVPAGSGSAGDDSAGNGSAAGGSAAADPAAGGPAEVVLARRVGASGRTSAFVQGRSATAADLQALGGRLLAFFGQHEHRRLTLASAQLDLLDGFCGREQLAARDELGRVHAETRTLERSLAQLRELAGTRDRDRDLLTFEIDEIEALAPTEDEKESLLAERERLRQMDGLLAAAGGGAEAIAPAAGEGGAAQVLAEAERLAAAVQGADPALDELAGRLAALRIEAEDLGGELRRYADSLEAEPGRLQEVEERLDAYERLERKHGGSVAAVLAHADRCRERRDRLEQAEVATERAEADLAAALERRDELAAKLTKARSKAAPRLAKRVREELAVLAMEGASFEVRLEPREEVGPAGAERVELMLAPNPGVPAAPIREAASGGELSRVMLALMTVAGVGESRSLVFDEVDAGVGGQTARAVGERLRALSESRQVLCITHLPQIAALATSHFRIEKSASDDTALTTVEELVGDGVLEELVRMLGADASDGAARKHAEELLAAA
jgi:DNA repair protein RecN (Recombination protein N)